MKPVDCEETKRSVHEYLHGELHEETMDGITAHIANCESCERDYDIESIFNQVVQRSCDEAPPADAAAGGGAGSTCQPWFSTSQATRPYPNCPGNPNMLCSSSALHPGCSTRALKQST